MSKIAIVLLCGLFAGCLTTAPVSNSETINLQGETSVVLTVHGLSCPLCSNNLDGQLRRIEGVVDATIDLKTGAVTVTLQPQHAVTTDDLKQAVVDAGFTLKAIAKPEP